MSNSAGTPIWFELTTPDRDRARDFYSSVVGWTVAPSPMQEHGGYLIATAPSGEAVAGLMSPPAGMSGFPGWVIYFACDDVDAAAAQVSEWGGSLNFGPMDIPGVGRFAVMSDPQGVVFNLMRGSSPRASAAFRQGPDGFGHGVWIELATPDPDGALAFYGRLFGWTKAGSMPMGPMGDYTFLGAGETRPGAVMSSATTGAPARWSMYFYVPDIDAAVAAAHSSGGALVRGPDQIPGGDYSARLTDPDGAAVGLVGPRRAG